MIELRIKELCKNKGIMINELADKVGMSRVSISAINAGRQNASIDTLEKIADALNVKIEELFAPKGETTHFLCPKCGAELQLIERKKEE